MEEKKGAFVGPSRTWHRRELVGIYAGWILRKLRHRWSDENQQAINAAVRAFQQFEYTDPDTGLSLKYNLFIPENYDAGKAYALVLFIHDAGATGRDPPP